MVNLRILVRSELLTSKAEAIRSKKKICDVPMGLLDEYCLTPTQTPDSLPDSVTIGIKNSGQAILPHSSFSFRRRRSSSSRTGDLGSFRAAYIQSRSTREETENGINAGLRLNISFQSGLPIRCTSRFSTGSFFAQSENESSQVNDRAQQLSDFRGFFFQLNTEPPLGPSKY